MRIANAVKYLRPDAEFTINGSEFVWQKDSTGKEIPVNLTWITPNVIPFTKKEFESAVEHVKQFEIKPYQMNRANAYPPLQELADALYWQSQGDSTKMQEYIQKVSDVKDAFPKV